MQCRISLIFLLFSLQWSNQNLFLVKTKTGSKAVDKMEAGNEYQNKMEAGDEYQNDQYLSDCDISEEQYYLEYYSQECGDTQVSTADVSATTAATATITGDYYWASLQQH